MLVRMTAHVLAAPLVRMTGAAAAMLRMQMEAAPSRVKAPWHAVALPLRAAMVLVRMEAPPPPPPAPSDSEEGRLLA